MSEHVPDNGFELELYPHQAAGAQWLAGRRNGILADEMGIGKSAQAITAARLLGIDRVLVLCPAVARVNWAREWSMWSSPWMREMAVLETGADHPPARGPVVASYDYARMHGGRLRAAGRWDALVLDEAHWLKDHEAARTRAVLGAQGLVHAAARTWALSGTPMPNHPGELWPLLFVMGATRLSYRDWVDRYCTGSLDQRRVRGGYQFRITGARVSRMDELHQVLEESGAWLRRRKEDVAMELPPITWSTLTVPAGDVDFRACRDWVQYVVPTDRRQQLLAKVELERQLLEQALSASRQTSAPMQATARALEGLADSVSTLRRYTGLQKVPALGDQIAQELHDRAMWKVVIFAVHVDVIETLAHRLDRWGVVKIYGGTLPRKRQNAIDSFQKNWKTRVFIGQVTAAGTAITLTAAHHVVFAEQSWVPGDNLQAAMRVHRIGQDKPVTVRVAQLADSLDESINRVLMRKSQQIAAIVDGERGNVGERAEGDVVGAEFDVYG